MADRRLSGLIAGLAVLLILGVLWESFVSPAPRRPAVVRVADSAKAGAAAPAPGTAPQASAVVPEVSPATPLPPVNQPSYIEQLARAESRRRIRASARYTYLSDVVALSRDSALHRWDDRVSRRVRVYIPAGTVENFQPAFLDVIRDAFQQWEEARVPVRFDVKADSERAEVHFLWKAQFDIERTGQTDVTWDQDGRILSGVVTIATHDPKGHPLSADDIRVVALHEIGHLVGLDHSSDSTDLMFATTRVRDLSPRDIRTALLLYRLPSGPLR
jgi:hypothetical protein